MDCERIKPMLPWSIHVVGCLTVTGIVAALVFLQLPF
jgi:hypothetical protein